VEIERQLEFLRERGCDAAQGPLFCRALPAGAFARLLRARGATWVATPPLMAQSAPGKPRSPPAGRRRGARG
jgi:hypothetical protein